MALYKRWWFSLPYGTLCNQGQLHAVNTRQTAVLLLDSRGREVVADDEGIMYGRVRGTFPWTDK